jgi:hypothetical protein
MVERSRFCGKATTLPEVATWPFSTAHFTRTNCRSIRQVHVSRAAVLSIVRPTAAASLP